MQPQSVAIYAPQPQLLSLSKQSLMGSGAGGVGPMAVVKTTGPNRTAQHRLKTRKLLSPCRTSSNERSEGGSSV